MLLTLYSLFVALGLFIGMLALVEVGRRAGARQRADEAASARPGLGAIDAAVFSLLGLLIAFTFSGAAARFDARRQLSIQEANNIGTAWLRIDTLPSDTHGDLQKLFRGYLDSRLRTARKLPGVAAAQDEARRGAELQATLWKRSVAACRNSPNPMAAMLYLPALNQMFDIASTRNATALIHPPLIIFMMLILLALASALLAGYGMATAKKRSWLHVLGLPAAVSAAVFVIVDLEFPRAGLIRIDESDQVLVDLRQSMDRPS